MKNIASIIEKYIKEHITDQYLDYIKRNKSFCDLLHHVIQLGNRSREYHNPSFVVLVIGPVKSGKSTFVNLVAKKYVSPTHFLECTVRPSLISYGEKESLTVYRSLNSLKKEEQMNYILDHINGLTNESTQTDVREEVYELSKENIDKYIKLDSIEVENDDILLTFIKTHGSILLQNNVYLVDMAGFDGANVNFDTPSYKAIVERADLIVFVQSSNSAISKVSKAFFELLQDTNKSVPICLVHNIFESAYWRTEESKKKDIDEQKRYAISQICSTYQLMMDSENAFSINLGKVYDFHQENYSPEIKNSLLVESERFDAMESKMYELFGKRENIRIKNCIARTKVQGKILLREITRLSNKYAEDLKKCKEIEEVFDGLLKSDINLTTPIERNIGLEELSGIVKIEIGYVKKKLESRGSEGKFKTKETRQIINELLKDIQKGITLLANKRVAKIADIKTFEEIQEWVALINHSVTKFIPNQIVKISCNVDNLDITFDYDISVEQLVPYKRFWRKHKREEINVYLKYIKDIFCGYTTEGEEVMIGYLEKSLLPQILIDFQEKKEQFIEKLLNNINSEIERLKLLSINNVISNIEEFHRERAMLDKLRRETEGLINIETNE